MSQEKKKFGLGIRLKPTDIPTSSDGDISISSVDNKIKVTTQKYDSYDAIVYAVGDIVRYDVDGLNYKCIQVTTGVEDPTDPAYFEIYEKSIVTEDQTQTLTNKTIDATAATGNNTLTADSSDILYDDSVDVTRTLGNNVQDALDAVKAQLEGQDQAAEITYDNGASGLAATFVKTALDELDADIDSLETGTSETDANVDDLITLSGVAENATDLGTFTGTTITDNVTNKVALQELETKLDDAESRVSANEVDIATNQSDITTNASNISTNTSNISETDTNTDDLITLSGVAENSTDLGTFTGTTITDNVTVKTALQELETGLDSAGTNKVDKVASTDNAIVRFDGASGDVQNSDILISDTDEVTGMTSLEVGSYTILGEDIISSGEAGLHSQVGGEVVLTENVYLRGNLRIDNGSDTATGSNVTLTAPDQQVIILTSGTLVSIDMIPNLGASSYVIYLLNQTGNIIEINNETGATAADQILTGTGEALSLADNAAIKLIYNTTASKWQVVGGSGAGGSSQIITQAEEDITEGDALYITTTGTVGKIDPDDDDKIEFIGFANNTDTTGNDITVNLNGVQDGFTGLTIGEFVYADTTTAGAITSTEPTASGFYKIIVGKAISATEIVIQPDLGASTVFINGDVNSDSTITNNQVAATDVTGASFDGSIYRAATLEYSIYRKTDDNEVAEVGQLRIVYKTVAASWSISNDFTGDDAGVTFSIDGTGQIQYTSTDLTGANYESKLTITTINVFEV